jgi:hypothetical protein
MTKKQYRTPKVSVGTVKKSIAAIASRWFLRNVSQRLAGSGVLGIRRSHRETVASERSEAQFEQLAVNARRSPGWILGNHAKDQSTNFLAHPSPSPHSSRLWKPMSNTTGSQPDASCTTVLGVTKTRGFVHPDQNLLNATQNSLCRRGESTARSFGVQSQQLLTESEVFEDEILSELKALTIQPRRCRRETVMARILSEHPKSSS